MQREFHQLIASGMALCVILGIGLAGCAQTHEITTGSITDLGSSEAARPNQRYVTADDVLAALCQKRLDDAKSGRSTPSALSSQQLQANERACAEWQARGKQIAAAN
jgi:hypothetical protein